jgi:hypothetical protein
MIELRLDAPERLGRGQVAPVPTNTRIYPSVQREFVILRSPSRRPPIDRAYGHLLPDVVEY